MGTSADSPSLLCSTCCTVTRHVKAKGRGRFLWDAPFHHHTLSSATPWPMSKQDGNATTSTHSIEAIEVQVKDAALGSQPLNVHGACAGASAPPGHPRHLLFSPLHSHVTHLQRFTSSGSEMQNTGCSGHAGAAASPHHAQHACATQSEPSHAPQEPTSGARPIDTYL